MSAARRFQVGDVDQVVLSHVGNNIPAHAEVCGSRLADLLHRLTFNVTPLRKVGQWRWSIAAPTTSGCRSSAFHDLTHVRLDVVLDNSSASSRPRDLMQINAQLSRQSPGCRSSGCRNAVVVINWRDGSSNLFLRNRR